MPKQHPPGFVITIVGTEMNNNGRSCEEHHTCGEVLCLDSVVRLRLEKFLQDGREKDALAVYWVTDGVDRCRVGFIPRYALREKHKYDGVLAQITTLYNKCEDKMAKAFSKRNYGACKATIIDSSDNAIMNNPLICYEANKKAVEKRKEIEKENQSNKEEKKAKTSAK